MALHFNVFVPVNHRWRRLRRVISRHRNLLRGAPVPLPACRLCVSPLSSLSRAPVPYQAVAEERNTKTIIVRLRHKISRPCSQKLEGSRSFHALVGSKWVLEPRRLECVFYPAAAYGRSIPRPWVDSSSVPREGWGREVTRVKPRSLEGRV